MQCIDGVCSHCGDQTVQSNEGEECDTGDRIDDDGCDHNCKFSCHGDADCADNDFCNGIEKCTTVTDGARTAKKCTAGTPRNDGEVCGTQRIC